MIARLDSYYQQMEASVAQETVDDGGAAEEVARLEAERIQAEQVEAARLQAEQEEAMRIKAAQEEAARIEAEQAEALEAERIRVEQEEAARVQAEQAEVARLQAEEAEAARVKAELEEAARLKAEQEEAERIKAEQEEAERIKVQQEEAERLKAEEIAKLKALEELKAEQEENERLQREAEAEKQKAEEELKQEETEEPSEEMEVEEAPKKSLFKAQIAPSQPLPNMAGPPPTSDDLESSPKKPVPLMSLNLDVPEGGKTVVSETSANQDLRLPKALEEALAFKSEWANQVGVSPSEIARVEREGVPTNPLLDQVEVKKPSSVLKPVQLVEGMDDDDDKSKGKKKNKKKKKKKNRPEEWARQAAEAERRRLEAEEEVKNEDVEVEYIAEKLDLDKSDPMHRHFARILEAFKIKDSSDDVEEESKQTDVGIHDEALKKVPKLLEADDMIELKEDEDDGQSKLSKRKLKKLNRLSVAELKQLVTRPDVVEMHDVTAKDPGLLVHLKSIRNTVPVPRHWCFKRKYLQGKRGIEKPPFDLPDFIKKTGIQEMRAALQEKEEAKGMKSKMREKVRPKLGKIDIDYQKLHDAFFKWQTKPRMTYHGDLYYEGKEFEIRLKEKKPGDLTDDLRTALGMPVGPNAFKVPPPWLISMQRYGPPPSYPNLKIPGNVAIHGVPRRDPFVFVLIRTRRAAPSPAQQK